MTSRTAYWVLALIVAADMVLNIWELRQMGKRERQWAQMMEKPG